MCSKFLAGVIAAGSYWGWKRDSFGARSPARCCGIVGYAGCREAQAVLLDGIHILQNRGYDSCGISTITSNNELITTKYASQGSTSDCIDLLARDAPKNHAKNHIGIGHTRWATHGAKTDVNAHPHTDYKSRISLVHNGTILNYAELKKELEDQSIPFRSETDTEVIANLIGWYLDKTNSLYEAVSSAVDRLQGTWGLAIIYKDVNTEMVLARNGSPLLVGCSENEVFVASESSALARYTNQFICLDDGEVCVLNPSGIEHLIGTRDRHKIYLESLELSCAPYDHWTLKEIMEQPESIERALNFGGRIYPIGQRVKLGGLEENTQKMLNVKNLIITGCGTSLYAGMFGELLMQYLGCFDTVQSIDASELYASRLPKPPSGGLLLLSQSGETLDTIKAYHLAAFQTLHCFSIVNVVGSQLARLTNCGVYLNAGREVAVASTKAFTSQVVVLALIAAWFAQHRDSTLDQCEKLMVSLSRTPLYTTKVLEYSDACRSIAETIKTARSVFILGKGLCYPVALEGALKIKEISYVHAEGFAAGALKHGPFALIDSAERTPVILLCLTDEHNSLMQNTAEQVKARGAYVIAIVDSEASLEVLADARIVIPNNGALTPLLCVVVLQLLAYHLAVSRGINPDKPRGLAKTVTVS